MIDTDIGVRIQFRHDQEGLEDGCSAQTKCSLVDRNDEVIGTGWAYCVQGDQFNKEIGRRLALTRALSNSELDKESRRSVWVAYFDR